MSRYFTEPTGQNPQLSCGICLKNVNNNHKSIRCSICNYKIHIKCMDIKAYESYISKADRYCLKCQEEIIPFQSLSDQQFYASAVKGLNNDIDHLKFSNSNNSLKSFFKDINNISGLNPEENDEDNDSPPINCSYVDIDSFNHKNNKDNISFFHLNIASLLKNKEELETFLNMIDLQFNCIGITETKLKTMNPISSIDIDGYNTFSTPTDAVKGGVLLYIKKHFNVKTRPNLDKMMYKSKQLESVFFIRICNKNKKNIIVGCIYCHPVMDLDEFNNEYFDPLMEKLLKEDKKLFLLGDFNIDLLQVESDTPIAHFFDTSNLCVPHIIHPTRITSTSRTLIDNIFSNYPNFYDGISGNLTLAISDHLAQFLIIREDAKKNSLTNNLFKRDFKNFDRENLLLDLLAIDWNETFYLDNDNLNDSFNSFFTEIDELVNIYLPLKKLTKKEIRNFKPWITQGLRTR